MNLHALRLFHVIATTGSVTRAAEVLSISQPAITAQIKKLEKEISLPLFKVQGRGIALTDGGEKLAVHAKRLFVIEQQIEHFLQEYRDGAAGSIRLSATYLPSHFLIPAWISKFKQQHEQIEMIVNTTNSTDALNQLLNMEVDLAIYGGMPEKYPDIIQSEELFQDELWFVTAPNHRLANQQVSILEMMESPFIMREEGSSTRERLMALCRTNNVPSPRIALQFNGLHETVKAVIAGYGASFVSSMVVSDYIKRGELCRVFVHGIHIQNIISIFTRKNENLSSAAANFIQLIRDNPYKEGY